MSTQENLKNELSRRKLLCGAMAAGLTVIGVAGCGSETPEPAGPNGPAGPGAAAPSGTAAVANADGTATVTGGGKLASGTALPFTLPNGQPALLINDKSGKLLALSALCTHNGCTVLWKDDAQNLQCPCHQSVFDASGKVQGGPANGPLPTFKVQKKGDDAVLTL